MLAVAAVHPKGEDDAYDGLYFRDSEMDTLASGMRNLPLLVEHDGEAVGKVLHAFKNPEDKRLYAVFETNTDTFRGCVAGGLVKHGLTGDVSLGHECRIQHSNDGTQRVVEKIPIELSIVEKGAREKTHILEKTTFKPSKSYINIRPNYPKRTEPLCFLQSTMAESQDTTLPSTSQIPAAISTQSNPDMVKQLLEQVKSLTEAQTLREKENADLRSANDKFASQVAKSDAAGKRKRETAIDGSIKEWMQTLLAKYETELKPHEEDLQGMFDGMKNNAEAEPMIQALACAAAAAKGSVTELETQYQANKKLKKDLADLQAKLSEQSTPMFSQKQERVETVSAQASASNQPAEPKTFNSIFSRPMRTPSTLKGAGMRETNPTMWKDLMDSAPRGNVGMPKIDAFMKMINK